MSPHPIFFTFLDEKECSFLYIIMASNHSTSHFPVTLANTSIFTNRHITFFLFLSLGLT
jgi:hypothetical protein